MKFSIILSTLLLPTAFGLRYIPRRIPESVILLSDNAAAEELLTRSTIEERASLGRTHIPSVNKRDFEDLNARQAEERRHNYLKNRARREIARLEKEKREKREKLERDGHANEVHHEKVEKDQVETKEERNDPSEAQKRDPAEPQLLTEPEPVVPSTGSSSGHSNHLSKGKSTPAQARSEAIKRASLEEAPFTKRLQKLPLLVGGPKRLVP